MSSDNLTKGLNADPVLTLLRETLVYGARNLATASTVAAISLYGIQVLPVTAASFGPVVKLTTLVEQELMDRVPSDSLMANAPTLDQSSSEEIQQVPVGFRDEFLRARAEGKKTVSDLFDIFKKVTLKG